MQRTIQIYNSFSREKETLVPISSPRVGLYVCGPTVYNDVHLGNCRTFVSFDIIYRYLMFAGYKVRYVRNITDVGHLLDDGEDRMSKGARLDQLEPMEVAQKYTVGFHDIMRYFNTHSPSVEPRATGHIIEQIDLVKEILRRGFAYIKNGSVYFDTPKFIREGYPYGKLSGRIVDELLSETRDNLKNQDEKNHASDFALWIKATDEHIMRWESPWSVGFPGWHLECSAMSTKYLGERFDIHGGGNDLKFPHHENEIAQNMGACGNAPANIWMHTNMLLLNGKKMSKSDGNTISPPELFSGQSVHISKPFSPMTVKFFFLQAHYRSPLDITDEALQAAEKGYKRLMDGLRILKEFNPQLPESGAKDSTIENAIQESLRNMDDDFNVPNALSNLFELTGLINSLKDGHLALQDIGLPCWLSLRKHMTHLIENVFGLLDETDSGSYDTIGGLMSLIIELRKDIRERKDWAASDKIRDSLQNLGLQLKDGKDGTEWTRL